MQPNSNAISIETEEDRYSRLRIIPWWNQDVLSRSKVMVVGAGALGNEIIKNLALLGLGNILIVDFDCIEMSNFSRSILLSFGYWFYVLPSIEKR
jgi:molybdopterin/thiamine biosynthesis adenylyltransferase